MNFQAAMKEESFDCLTEQINETPERRRLAVIVTEFPKTTETFIMRDVVSFHQKGYDIRIYHLTHYNRHEVVHDFAKQTLGWSRDFAYLASADVLSAFFRVLFRKPRALAEIIRDIVFGSFSNPVMMLKSIFILPKSLRISEDILEWGADHVHAAYAGHPATCAWIVRRVAGVPFSVSCHAHDIFETRALLRTKLPEAEFVRTISEYNRKYILQHVPSLANKPPVVIHVGAFLDGLTPHPTATSAQWRVLYVGSLESRKGVDLLLRALALAALGDWHLDILGDGPERKRLENLAGTLGLKERVTFKGAQSNESVADAMSRCSVMVVPSRIGPRNQTEGLPTVIVEALAHERPVIATRLTGIPEIIIDGVTGWLFEVDDVNGLVRALEDVRKHPQEARCRASQGRNLVVSQFDQAQNAEALLSLIASSIDEKRRRRP
ncbi:glycosyltransferase involved in cell wall biosynthesis [Microvirga flocculans]|uniref:Glycosyltransferase involved in cell wall biosynthesis n=1 Tax=Microvirga flocculans TaxID=217168 RepID=A0A7W6IGM2_9HYPH|nr:glycosyltransferase family 4 protein [Microvirga flocculans]MBB4040796.1 glycosyltransferase involved in cell wall biosynthesis [Microvirga flocculans]